MIESVKFIYKSLKGSGIGYHLEGMLCDQVEPVRHTVENE